WEWRANPPPARPRGFLVWPTPEPPAAPGRGFGVLVRVPGFFLHSPGRPVSPSLFINLTRPAPPPSRLPAPPRATPQPAPRRRLLLLATYRDTEPALTSTVADLIREPVTSRLELSGLALAEVGRQLAAITGGPVAPELAARIHELTGGNPFFVSELACAVGGNR